MRKTVKKIRVLYFMIGLLGIGLIGCRGDDAEVRQTSAEPVTEQGEQTKSESKEQAQKQKNYVFYDVEENRYEAELLEELPKCSYDFSNLTEKNGFKLYEDKNTGIKSKLGIDVSEFQGEIDWQEVKNSGIEFVIVRMGYRGYGESGTLVVDPMFDAHVKGAMDAGLQVGVYFFSQAISDEEAKEEAAFVLEHIEPYHLTGPVIFDTEEIKYDTARTDHNTVEQFTDYCIIFCDEIKKAGYEMMIYANMKWMAFTLDLTRLTEYPFWYADYHDIPQCPYEYAIWQYTETGSVPGVKGNVDINLWFQQENK